MKSAARLLAGLMLVTSARAQTAWPPKLLALLPKDARVIETANVPLNAGKKRELVLWMQKPFRVFAMWDRAGDYLYGDHWVGRAFVSLVDPARMKLINTIEVLSNYARAQDGFFVPFRTHNYSYFVPKPDAEGLGTPWLLNLQDFTGEGVAGQFALYDHVVSGISTGTVLGYSQKADRAVQYSIERTSGQFLPVVSLWAEQVFSSKPERAGQWRFTWEAGHGDFSWTDVEIHFDPIVQKFIERVASRPYPGFWHMDCTLASGALPAFLDRLDGIAPGTMDMTWFRGLIEHSAPKEIGTAGFVPKVNGTTELLSAEYQVADGSIRMEFASEAPFGEKLQAQLAEWCDSRRGPLPR